MRNVGMAFNSDLVTRHEQKMLGKKLQIQRRAGADGLRIAGIIWWMGVGKRSQK